MGRWISGPLAYVAGESWVAGRLLAVSLELLILATVVALLVACFRVRAPRLRALLWLLVLAKPVIGLLLGAPLPLAHVKVADRNSAEDFKVVAAATQAAIGNAQAPSAPTPPAVPPGDAGIGATVPLIDALHAGDTERPKAFSRFHAVSWPRVLGWTWLAGVFLFVVLTVVDQLRVQRMRHLAVQAPPDLGMRLALLASDLGLKRAPRLLVTGRLDSPALAGWLAPDILLPRWMAVDASTDGAAVIDWMLRHELMHYRFNDPVALAVRRLAEVLLFFHPAVWWAGRRWEEAMELACDRALVTSESAAREYAEGLYRVLAAQGTASRGMPGVGLFATRTQIGQRIAALVTNPLGSPARLSMLSVAGLVVFAIFGLATGLGFSAAEPETGVGAVKANEDNPLGLSPDKYSKFKQTGDAFRTIQMAIQAYRVDNSGRFPAKPQALTTPVAYLPGIPDDPFGNGPLWIGPYLPDWSHMELRSVGLDGRDDRVEGRDDHESGLTRPRMTGDIIVYATAVGDSTTRTELLVTSDNDVNYYLFRCSDPGTSDTTASAGGFAVFDDKASSSTPERQELMQRYAQAAETYRGLPRFQDHAFSCLSVLRSGWDDKFTSLPAHLDAAKSAFDQVRAASATGHPRGAYVIPSGQGYTPYAIDLLARAMAVEGAREAACGKWREALDTELALLTMGDDYLAPDSLNPGAWATTWIQDAAMTQIPRIVKSRKLSRDELRHALSALKQADAGETAMRRLVVYEMLRSGGEKQPNAMVSERAAEATRDKLRQHLMKPIYSRDDADMQKQLAADTSPQNIFLPHLRHVFDTISWSDHRYQMVRSRLLQTQLAAALEDYYLVNGRYPGMLAALVPTYFSTLPVDPFSGATFRYTATGNGSRYELRGNGPAVQPGQRNGSKFYPLADALTGVLTTDDIILK